jgi:hypothetical protein
MHLFSGEIERFEKPEGDPEDEWRGELLSEIKGIIEELELNKPFPKTMEEYYNMQLEIMRRGIL